MTTYHITKESQSILDKTLSELFDIQPAQVEYEDITYEAEYGWGHAKNQYGPMNFMYGIGTPGELHWNWGKKTRPEVIQKISESVSGEKNHFYGKKHSEEALEKIKAAARSRVKKECPHCGIKCVPGNYAKYHGINCKEYIQQEISNHHS